MRSELRQGITCALAVMLGMLLVLPAKAAEPSNAELLKMILELNSKLEAVQAKASDAQERALNAEKALRQTQHELAVTREQFEAVGGRAVGTVRASGRLGSERVQEQEGFSW